MASLTRPSDASNLAGTLDLLTDTRAFPGGSQHAHTSRQRSNNANGIILYSPRTPLDRRHRATPTFPTPHIRSRQRRPHTIHIVAYPPGYIPSEIRSLFAPSQRDKPKHKRPRPPGSEGALRGDTSGQAALKKHSHSHRRRTSATQRLSLHPTQASLSNCPPSTRARVLEKLRSVFTSHESPVSPTAPLPPPPDSSTATTPAPVPAERQTPSATGQSRPNSLIIFGRRLSLSLTRSHDSAQLPPLSHAATDGAIQGHHLPAATMSPTQSTPHSQAAASILSANRPGSSRRGSFISVRSVKNIMTSSTSDITQKPIASAGGMSLDIVFAEPHVFLAGFDHDGQARRSNHGTSAMLRGKLRLVVTRNMKIRGVSVKLQGKARTDWPEGLPPLRVDVFEQETLRSQHLTFYNAMHGSWGTPYGNVCNYKLKTPSEDSLGATLSRLAHGSHLASDSASLSSSGLSAKDIKRLSLQQVQARSFEKDDSPMVEATHAKGFKIFPPGTYEYTFEFPIDHHQLETIRLPYGSVKWELEGTIERAGTFKPNLHGVREVSVIRVPDQLSLETVEPISISRQWEDQLFYDIVISGKSFPIGGKIPIAFKLTPLAKVQIHKLKVLITESAEYWTTSRRVTRKDPARKILLFEKVAGRPVDDQYRSSEINFVSGGELTPEQRREARETATHRRELEASRRNTPAEPLPDATDNLLGDLDLGLETYWGATELEMNVQIPTCKQMARNPLLRIHHDCSWRNAVVHHWIKVVMRISRLDPEDPAGKRRRHFEISIDSPLTILNCLATQANTFLPRYTGMDVPSTVQRSNPSCGCSDAYMSPASSPVFPAGFSSDALSQGMPAPPQAAHLHQHSPLNPGDDSIRSPLSSNGMQATMRSAYTEQEASAHPRPMHLLRLPSYAPPAFDADESPPLAADVMTPPPNYDAIVGTPSVDGLADYFSRLANYDDTHDENGISTTLDDDSESDGDSLPTRIASRGGRVNVVNPRTPGGLRHGPSRSMDIQRPMVPVNLHMAASPLRRAGNND